MKTKIHLHMVIANRQYLQILLLLQVFHSETNPNGVKSPVKLFLDFNYRITATTLLKYKV